MSITVLLPLNTFSALLLPFMVNTQVAGRVNFAVK
jgi:hypothetical protein